MLKVPKELILTFLYIIIVSILAIMLNMSSQMPYSPYNIGFEGYSKLLDTIASIEIAKDLNHIEPFSIAILPLTKEISNLNSEYIKNLTVAGVTIIILDENGYSNKLLKDLGLGIEIRKTKVLDEVSKYGSREYPVIVIDFNNTILRIVTYKPSYIASLKEFSKEITGSTSDYAYADEDGNGFYTLGEVIGKYNVICSASLDKGSLWVIADLDILSNRVIDYLDNRRFIEILASSRKVYIALEGLDVGLFDIIRYTLTRGLGGIYSNIFIFPLVFAVLLTLYVILEHYI